MLAALRLLSFRLARLRNSLAQVMLAALLLCHPPGGRAGLAARAAPTATNTPR